VGSGGDPAADRSATGGPTADYTFGEKVGCRRQGTMSDQANNLRQLVRAHRQWCELLGQPIIEPKAQNDLAKGDEGRREDRTETSMDRIDGFVAAARDWARAWRRWKAGRKKGDPT
jgi:hypothetical protein